MHVTIGDGVVFILVLALKQKYFLVFCSLYNQLWMTDAIKKKCDYPGCKAYVAIYDLHIHCSRHRICVSIKDLRFDSKDCLICPKLFEKEKRILGHLGA